MRGIANKMEKLGKPTFENIAGITKGVFEFSITLWIRLKNYL